MSAEIIELEDVDGLGAGAVGEPGQRAFYIQARTEQTQLTVLVEKEQVALLAAEAVAFLDKIADDYPELPFELPPTQSALREPTVPLFRARLIGLGLRPRARARAARAARARRRRGRPTTPTEVDDDDDEGYVARIYATRAQVRAMAARGAEAVAGGRPPCPLCEQPMDPSGHRVLAGTDARRAARRARRRPSSRSSVACATRRTRPSSSRRRSTAWSWPRSTSRAAASGRCGTSRRARSASARSRPTSCPTRSAGASCRSRSCATARSVSARCSASSTTIPTSTSSPCATSTRIASASSRGSTCSPTTPTARAVTASTTRSTT